MRKLASAALFAVSVSYAVAFIVERTGILQPAAAGRYSTNVVGLYETDPTNCGNRIATTGERLYVDVDKWMVLRGDANGEISFDTDGAIVGMTRFVRC